MDFSEIISLEMVVPSICGRERSLDSARINQDRDIRAKERLDLTKV